MVDRKGSEGDAARKLYEENYELRKEKRNIQDKLDAFTDLSEEDIKKLKAYKEINDDPEKLTEIIQNAEKDTDELNSLKREKELRSVAGAMNWNHKALNKLSGDDLEYIVETDNDDEGNPVKKAYVKTEDGRKPLVDYAKENWDYMMPALKQNGQKEQDGSNRKQLASQSPANGSDANSGGYMDRFKESNKKAAGLKTD